MAKKKITIEDLAGMVAKGFENNDKRFTALETKVDNLEAKVDNLETKVDSLAVKVDNNHQELLAKISGYVPRSEFETVLERIEEIEKFVGIKNNKGRQ